MKVTVNGEEIEIYEYQGRRVLLGSQMDLLLGLNKGTFCVRIRTKIKNNILVPNEDYFFLEDREILNEMNIKSKSYFLFESGVKKCLTKTEDSKFLKEYFSNKEEKKIEVQEDTHQEELIQNVEQKKNQEDIQESQKINNKIDFKQIELDVVKTDAIDEKMEDVEGIKDFNKEIIESNTKEQDNIDIFEEESLFQLKNIKEDIIKGSVNRENVSSVENNNNQIVNVLSLVNDMMNNFMKMHMNMIQQQNELIKIQNETNESFRQEIRYVYEKLLNNNFNTKQINRNLVDNYLKNKTKRKEEVIQNEVDINEQTFVNDDFEKEEYSLYDESLSTTDTLEYGEWKKVINKAANKILEVKSGFKTKNEIMSTAYKELTKQYGIVWDQEKKEFYKNIGRGPVNTMEVMWFIEKSNPIYKNLFISKLNTLYSNVRKNNWNIEKNEKE